MKFTKPFAAPKDMPNPLLQPLYNVPASCASSQQTIEETIALETWQVGVKLDKTELVLSPVSSEGLEQFDYFWMQCASVTDGDFYGLLVGAEWKFPKKADSKNPYEWGVGFKVKGQAVVSVWLDNQYTQSPQARLSFNLGEIVRLGVLPDFNKLLGFLLPAGLDTEDLIAKVRLVEVAVDLPYAQQAYFWISFSRQRKKVFKATTYVGTRKSKVTDAVYDKAKEAWEVSGIQMTQSHMLRAEARVRPSKPVRISHLNAYLKTLPNPFLNIRPVLRTDFAVEFDPQHHVGLWQVLTDKGFFEAWKQVTPYARKKMKLRIEGIPSPDWWQPEEFWKQGVEML